MYRQRRTRQDYPYPERQWCRGPGEQEAGHSRERDGAQEKLKDAEKELLVKLAQKDAALAWKDCQVGGELRNRSRDAVTCRILKTLECLLRSLDQEGP